MGTRNHPGIFDCTPAKCLPGEPYFILAGRDVLAPDIVEVWAIRAKSRGCNHDKTREAMHLAEEMREYTAPSFTGRVFAALDELEPDEPHFVLRGRDSLAADLVETWLKRASEIGCSPTVITAVADVWRRMADYPNQKNPD